MFAALVERVGDLSLATMNNDAGVSNATEVTVEAIRIAAIAIRVATEGDESFINYDPCPAIKWIRANFEHRVGAD